MRQINSSVCLHQSAKTLKPLVAIRNLIKESLANCAMLLLGALGSDATLGKIQLTVGTGVVDREIDRHSFIPIWNEVSTV